MVLKVIFIIFFIVLTFLISPHPTLAANISVNTTTDELNSNSNCSLREAIQSANTDTAIDACLSGSGADVITLPAGTYILSLVGAGEDANLTGDLDITNDLDINGASLSTTIIDANSIDRVLEIHPGATVLLNNLTIQGGNPNSSGGGIFNRATLTLNTSLVTNNTGLDFGGGIYNIGTLSVTNSTISNNQTTGSNLSGGGGGVFNLGDMTLTASTVNTNITLGRGGGIYNLDLTLTLTNSTLSDNTALNGGGIFNRFGTVQSTNSTIAYNTATDNGGGVWNFGGITTLTNTIISNNAATTTSDNCAGAVSSLGYNLASDGSCNFSSTGDINSTDPTLGPLASNGGPTQTHALLLNSPAVDVIPTVSCVVITDQRGILRPQGPACDIGAFELQPSLPSQCSGVMSDYNLILGTNNNDNLTGSSKKDLIFGFGGNDKISGLSGNDCLIGGPGNDEIDGGSAHDVLLAGEGNDKLYGVSGNDYLDGQGGNDDINGGSGNDNLLGGSGDDNMKGDAGADLLDGQAGANDNASGGSGTDTCTAEIETSCEL